MRKITVVTALAIFFTLNSVCAQTLEETNTVKKCNRIMRNIYLEILKLSGSYEELSAFNESSYEPAHKSNSFIKRNETNYATEGIRFVGADAQGAPSIDIYFSWNSCKHGMCQKPPSVEFYIKDINNYLVFSGERISEKLKNELIRIVNKNTFITQ